MQYNPKQFCNLKTYLIDIFAHDINRLCKQEQLGHASMVKEFVKIYIWISLTCNMEFVKIALYISCHKKSKGMQAWSKGVGAQLFRLVRLLTHKYLIIIIIIIITDKIDSRIHI